MYEQCSLHILLKLSLLAY